MEDDYTLVASHAGASCRYLLAAVAAAFSCCRDPPTRQTAGPPWLTVVLPCNRWPAASRSAEVSVRELDSNGRVFHVCLRQVRQYTPCLAGWQGERNLTRGSSETSELSHCGCGRGCVPPTQGIGLYHNQTSGSRNIFDTTINTQTVKRPAAGAEAPGMTAKACMTCSPHNTFN